MTGVSQAQSARTDLSCFAQTRPKTCNKIASESITIVRLFFIRVFFVRPDQAIVSTHKRFSPPSERRSEQCTLHHTSNETAMFPLESFLSVLYRVCRLCPTKISVSTLRLMRIGHKKRGQATLFPILFPTFFYGYNFFCI